jgi:hypothetical protein
MDDLSIEIINDVITLSTVIILILYLTHRDARRQSMIDARIIVQP